jgi:hypothetical protein
MKITLPDKSDDVSNDLHVSEADFLKRHSNYIPEIGCKIGKLDKMSMFKPLHANVKSNVETPRTVAISCIETFMHELFAHGREEYEKDQSKMQELCRRHNLVIPAVQYTFSERVTAWREKYLNETCP